MILERPRADTLVTDDAFMRQRNWTSEQAKGGRRFFGSYRTRFGFIPGFVELYCVTNGDGCPVAHDYVAFVERLPKSVVRPPCMAAFVWNADRRAFMVHFVRPCVGLHQTVLGVERALDAMEG